MIPTKENMLKEALENFSENYAEKCSGEKSVFTLDDIQQAFKAGAEWHKDFTSLADVLWKF